MIKAIIFDYGGVICDDFSWQGYLGEFASGADLQVAIQAISQSWLDACTSIDDSKFWSILSDTTSLSAEELQKHFQKQIQPNDEVLELLKELKTEYKIAMLSNHAANWLGPVIKSNGLNEIFDEIVTSYGYGSAKPEHSVYMHTLKRLNLAPDEVIFIDDRAENVEAAQAVGMYTILFTTYLELLRTLIVVGVDCDFLTKQRKIMDMDAWNEYLKTGKAISNEEMQSWLKELMSGKHTKWEDRKLKIS
jgi:HAD superfamily hydrolase (TIGR01509 family)